MKQKIITALTVVTITATAALADVTVVNIKGKAQFKAGNQWAFLAPGMRLAKGAKISTGANSDVVLNVNGDTIVIRQLSLIKIDENILNAKESNTTIGLKRGGINAKIARDRKVKTSFKVSTPVATSSVRGTQEEISFGPGFGMKILVIEGEIGAEGKNGSSNVVKGKLVYKHGSHKGGPDFIASNLKDGSTGKSPSYLTDDEKKHMDGSTDLFNGPDEGSSRASNSKAGASVSGTLIFVP